MRVSTTRVVRLAVLVALVQLLTILLTLSRRPTGCTDDVSLTRMEDVSVDDVTVYRYPEEVDLRVVVLTLSRPSSLDQLLSSLDQLELDGDSASLDIWIDRHPGSDRLDCATLDVARRFRWSRGQKRIHVHRKHVGIYGQWMDTWRPEDDHQLALILEDDVTVSPYAYRWIRAVHRRYGSRPDVSGYTLQSEDVELATGRGATYRLSGPPTDPVFMYKRIGTWGFAPNPRSWRHFRDWYGDVRTNSSFRPYVAKAPAITSCYRILEDGDRQDTMWSMWHVYHSELYSLYTVYNNLETTEPGKDVHLAENSKQSGLHFRGSWFDWMKRSRLMTVWSDSYVNLPQSPAKYDWDGTVM